jgi:hypothetical protein
MAEKRACPLCGDPLEDAPAVHDVVQCEQTELRKGRNTIKVLKQSVNDWKEAWFQLREIIGKLWWYHPAIDNDEERAYYQTTLQRIRDLQKKPNDVYVGDKLVGSGTSPEAMLAIKRLFQQP